MAELFFHISAFLCVYMFPCSKIQLWLFTSNPFPTATAARRSCCATPKRNGKRIERKTLANLSKTPAFIVDAIRILLKGGVIVNSLDQAFTVNRSLPHGHVAALVALASQIGLPRILHRTGSRQRDLALAAIIARIQTRHCQSAFARNCRQLPGHFTQA